MDSSRPHPRRTRIACKTCRQNKIRCGMRNPPCARCSRLDIDCTVEPHFRRSNQRDRMRQLESHVEELHQTLLIGTANVDGGVHPSPLPNPESALTLRQEPATHPEEPVCDETVTYKIGPVTIDQVQAERLHAVFFSKYHPILPFLNEKCHAAERYRTSTLLFWSIVAVAARHFDPNNSNLLSRLTPVLDEWIHKTVLSDGLVSVAHVQAVLLLGYWPLPNYRFWTDNSLLYANIAVMSAMQLGLHRPGYEQEYARKRLCLSSETISGRNKTWIATVILAQCIATCRGLPPTVTMIDDMSFTDIPLSLQHTLLIHKCSHKMMSELLGNIQANHAFYELLDTLEKRIDSLEASISQTLSFTNSIRLASARLYLQCMFFIAPETTPDEESRLKQQRKDGVLKAYTTATSMVTMAISHDNSLDELPYVPVEVLRMIFAAALVVFRVVHSSFAELVPSHGPQSFPESGRALCNMACFAIQRCALHERDHDDGKDKDLAARMVDMLRSIWRGAEEDTQLKSQEPLIMFKSRMGAGIVFDCLNIWRSRYRTRGAQQPPDSQANAPQDASVNNLAQMELFIEPDNLSVTQSAVWDDSLGWNLPDGFVEQGPEEWNLNGYL